jgi:hypothetical protein
MAENKTYSAKEAAVAVLQKAREVLEKSELLKKEHKHIGWDKLHSKLEGEGYSKESADKIAGSIKAKVEKSEDTENDKKANAKPSEHNSKDAGDDQGPAPKGEINPKEHVEGEPGKVEERVKGQEAPEDNPKEQAEGNNNEWGTEPATYGTLKLAHFIGRMHAKRSQKAKEVTAPDANKKISAPDAKAIIDPKDK